MRRAPAGEHAGRRAAPIRGDDATCARVRCGQHRDRPCSLVLEQRASAAGQLSALVLASQEALSEAVTSLWLQGHRLPQHFPEGLPASLARAARLDMPPRAASQRRVRSAYSRSPVPACTASRPAQPAARGRPARVMPSDSALRGMTWITGAAQARVGGPAEQERRGLVLPSVVRGAARRHPRVCPQS